MLTACWAADPTQRPSAGEVLELLTKKRDPAKEAENKKRLQEIVSTEHEYRKDLQNMVEIFEKPMRRTAEDLKIKDSEIDIIFPPGVLITYLRLSTIVCNSMESSVPEVGPICQIFINTVTPPLPPNAGGASK